MQWTDRVGRRLKPRDLHVFLAVAEQGNMAKAAERLAISRPVVSKTIADLSVSSAYGCSIGRPRALSRRSTVARSSSAGPPYSMSSGRA